LGTREAREALEEAQLSTHATRASGAGDRETPEEPDAYRTCFERDRDRIVHSTSFRRLAGKTQVFVLPLDHQRTRLTHALEVAQVAVAIAQPLQLNVPLTEAIALGHDCGHGPGGHASEDALAEFVDGGYNHAQWGADVALAPLNLCVETLDGIRNHSWSRPAPRTPEGEVVSWADRIAYVCHDFEDAVRSNVVTPEDLPEEVREVCGTDRSTQIGTFITSMITCALATGKVGMMPREADALAAFRKFNYNNIYFRPASQAQASSVIAVLTSLTEYYLEHPQLVPDNAAAERGAMTDDQRLRRRVVAYVGGMTDRYAFDRAVDLCGWDRAKLPRAVN
jgi:dGTPase